MLTSELSDHAIALQEQMEQKKSQEVEEKRAAEQAIKDAACGEFLECLEQDVSPNVLSALKFEYRNTPDQSDREWFTADGKKSKIRPYARIPLNGTHCITTY